MAFTKSPIAKGFHEASVVKVIAKASLAKGFSENPSSKGLEAPRGFYKSPSSKGLLQKPL